MRILLDENLPRNLAGRFPGHQCRSVAESGWSGKRNGELLALADPLFDVRSAQAGWGSHQSSNSPHPKAATESVVREFLELTLDKSLPYQQSLQSGRIAVLIIRARSNRIPDLLPVIPECLAALESIRPRQVVRVGALPPRRADRVTVPDPTSPSVA